MSIQKIDEEFDTLSTAVNAMNKRGYTEGFEAIDTCIVASYSKTEYQPNDLKIVKTFRFEGMTDPQDQTALFVLEAHDGTKGTLVMSYSSQHDQNVELIKQIPEAS
ncbi:phosphoribosylpyrophosphate synthetase [Reichenbachiella sp. 5M10]|uniref:hypothetical protein n=1 Tax=Reichenbachiella sp. 5M10 TaxID=1889772 RepID=UPI000C675B00|nr:hypothetical protein [Reichenbachiella sp. 5M10]PIB35124.1 phosphoribosylpyrophosphate synthetase [Reichenbachiella sp. 5M10]